MTPQQKLELLLLQMAPEIRDAFLAAIQGVVDGVILTELTEAIDAGNYEQVVAILNVNGPTLRPLTRAIEDMFERFGDAKGDTFPKRIQTPFGSMVFHFDARNPSAEAWLKMKSSELISRIDDDTRFIVRNAIQRGLERGQNPRVTALDIVGRIDPATGERTGGLIGLSKNQETWVASARRKLETLDATYFNMELRDKRFDGTVRKAIESGKPLPAAVVDKLIIRYKSNSLRNRAENIARTETMHALNQAEFESVKQVIAKGSLAPEAVMKEWDATADGRTRSQHRAMNGQRVAFDEPFVAPDGTRLMFPGDTSLGAGSDQVGNCRCRLKTVVDWFHGVT